MNEGDRERWTEMSMNGQKKGRGDGRMTKEVGLDGAAVADLGFDEGSFER